MYNMKLLQKARSQPMKRKELFSAFPVKDLGGAGDRREDNRLLVTGLSGDRKLQQLCGKIELLALPI